MALVSYAREEDPSCRELLVALVVQNPGWLFYLEDYTTQIYRDYDKTMIRIPINQPV